MESGTFVEIRVERQRRNMSVQHERLQSLFLQRRQHDPRFSQSATAAIDRKPIRHSREHEADMVGEELLPLLKCGRRTMHDHGRGNRRSVVLLPQAAYKVQQVHHQPPKPIPFYANHPNAPR